MLRQSAARLLRAQSKNASFAGRRSASTAQETASKVQDAAAQVKDSAAKLAPSHHKPSSDVPWLIGSVLVFAPTIFYMTAPPGDHKPLPTKEKFKAKLRIPDPDAAHYKIPEEVGDKAGEGRPHGEGDHGLRELQEQHEEHTEKQRSPPTRESADQSNHSAKGGLKGDAEKFTAAARGASQLNQMGGGEAVRDTKALNEAARAASKEPNTESGHGDYSTPDVTKEKFGEALTKRREGQSEESDKKDTGENKDEQL